MKKLYAYFLALAILQIPIIAEAQGIYQFWGTTPLGGDQDGGFIFSTRSDGLGLTTQYSFKVKNPGKRPGSGYTVYNGKFYKLCRSEGFLGKGMVIEYDPATKISRNAGNLAPFNGGEAIEKMTLVGNKLYGVLRTGAIWAGPAQLIEFDPATGSLILKYTFPEGDGGSLMSELTFLNGRLFGISSEGGNQGYGHIYALDLASGQVTKRLSLNIMPGLFYSSTMLAYNNKLLVTGKVMAEFDPNANTLTQKFSFKDLFNTEATSGGMVLFNNKIFGLMFDGADTFIYEYDPATNQVLSKANLSTTGATYSTGRMVVFNNKLYGTARGGNNNEGLMYEYNPATGVVFGKFHFGLLMGTTPVSPMTEFNGKLYGNTTEGGDADAGTIFEFNPVANSVSRIFDYEDGLYEPSGKLMYYSGKLYGFAIRGGFVKGGALYSYELATNKFTIVYEFPKEWHWASDQNGLILYNNRFYGTIAQTNETTKGVLFEFNPANNQFITKHSFITATGSQPNAYPVMYNGKLYGTTNFGGNNNEGVLYEFDIASNTYTTKVHFGNAFGKKPSGPLTLWKNKLFGCTEFGGNQDMGTLYEYSPDINGLQVRYHFSEGSGYWGVPILTLYNDKLYGMGSNGGAYTGGTIFSYDPSLLAFTVLHSFKPPQNFRPINGLTAFDNKLFGLTNMGGPLKERGGTLFQYDLSNGQLTTRQEFTGMNGRRPRSNQMLLLPAKVAPGTPGNCSTIQPVTINAANATEWVAFTDEEGNAVAEINANGNILGDVNISFYTHDGDTRKDEAGRFYLSRNLSITPQFQPASPVSVRIYIRKTEYDQLRNTAGAGVNSLTDISVFKNEDKCSNAVYAKATPFNSDIEFWGTDYVYSFQTNGFSSFYLAGKSNTTLPIKLEYFRGQVKSDHNLLQWKASCTNDVIFTIERSGDGTSYSSIGMLMAGQAECGMPFQFKDEKPLPGKAWYRLQIKEPDAAVEYSGIIQLSAALPGSLEAKIVPNPVTGPLLTMQIDASKNEQLQVSVTDMQGRTVARTMITVQKGSQQISTGIAILSAGIYQLSLQGSTSRQTLRFVKQ